MKQSSSIALLAMERPPHSDQRLGIWDMWKRFNISPVVETDVLFQMLISFPVKPGVRGESEGERDLPSPPP